MPWEILLHKEVERWYLTICELDPETAEQIGSALDHLQAEGPTAGRPLVDRVIRMLFAFDPFRRALVLVAGDKSGDWSGWYRKNIPIAEARYAEHLTELEKEER